MASEPSIPLQVQQFSFNSPEKDATGLACPHCGELNPPKFRLCASCHAWLPEETRLKEAAAKRQNLALKQRTFCFACGLFILASSPWAPNGTIHAMWALGLAFLLFSVRHDLQTAFLHRLEEHRFGGHGVPAPPFTRPLVPRAWDLNMDTSPEEEPLVALTKSIFLEAFRRRVHHIRINAGSRGARVDYELAKGWEEQMKLPLETWTDLREYLRTSFHNEHAEALISTLTVRYQHKNYKVTVEKHTFSVQEKVLLHVDLLQSHGRTPGQ